MAWNDGYVIDISYAPHFFKVQSPAHLSFACILNGVEPVPLDKPFTYCELGFGQGLTANILAASNPQGQFYAADFNPAQVLDARDLAMAAELNNLTLLENSFLELAEGKVALPQFDFITLHGVYTWVSQESRCHIVKFISRYLKTGGIAYVSYNALPGSAEVMPLQRLMREHADLNPNRSDVQVEQARQFISKIATTKGNYFSRKPALNHRLKKMEVGSSESKWVSNYLPHEYMNRFWQPQYHADVAQDLAEAKSEFAASAQLCDNFPSLIMSSEQRDILDAVPQERMRETVKDYLLDTGFRQDIYVRGVRRMSPARQKWWLRQTGLAMTVLRDKASMEIKLRYGTINANEAIFGPVFDALAQAPRTLQELAAMPALEGKSMDNVMQIAALLTDSDQAFPYFICSANMDSAPAHRLNLALTQEAKPDSRYQTLASPFLGSGVDTPFFQRITYLALRQSAQPDARAVAEQAWKEAVESGKETGDSKEQKVNEYTWIVEQILARRAPVWRHLKML